MSDFKRTPKQKEATALIANNEECGLLGGSRCVSGDTVIDGQTKTIKELAEIGAPVRVKTSHGFQMAEPPFKKGRDYLLEIKTESGRRIEVTTDHRFWNGFQWVYAKNLSVGDSLACLPFGQSQEGDFLPSNDTPSSKGYKLEKVSAVTRTAIQDYYTLHVPITEQYFANGFLNHNSGKTFIVIRSIIIRAAKVKSRHLIARFRFNHAKISVGLDTLPKVLSLCFPDLQVTLNKTDWYFTLPNGSEIWIAGVDDGDRVERILGNEYSTIFLNECSQLSYDSVTMLQTRLAENSGLKLRMIYDFNPPSTKHWTCQYFVEGRNPSDFKPLKEKIPFITMNPTDNMENLPKSYLDMLERLPRAQRDRFLLGLFASGVEGALWTMEMVDQAHAKTYGEPVKIVVAVDPAVTSNEHSDLTGIVVCAVDENGEGIVLADLSIKTTPLKWAQVVVNAYDEFDANEIVAETNQGGDLVEATLRSVGYNGKVVKVHASKGKYARAEPVAALYEQGKIAHAERFYDLETEMTEYVPLQVKSSPDRLDAMVWGFTRLMLTKQRRNVRAMTL